MSRPITLLTCLALACPGASGCARDPCLGLKVASAVADLAVAAAGVAVLAEAARAPDVEGAESADDNNVPGPAQDYRTVLNVFCPRGGLYSLLCPVPGMAKDCFFQSSKARVYTCSTHDCAEGPAAELKSWCAAN
jgi:hypothetical protein